MGFSRKRRDGKGKIRYQALYDDARGVRQTAGTFATRKEADKAWQRAEVRIAEGKPGDPRRGRQTFRNYVEVQWLPHHRMEASTRQGYTSALYRHIMPFFGVMKMREILPEHVRQWVTERRSKGVSPRQIQYCKVSVLNAIFTTALKDHVIVIHSSRGVETGPVPQRTRKIITAEQFDALYQALPDADARLLIETDIESGLRWGELTELRPKDIDFDTRILTVSRSVVELARKYHPEGERFLVKEYPKNGRHRRFKLSAQIVDKLKTHVEAEGLGPDDLLFSRRAKTDEESRLQVVADPDSLGRTEPNDKGRTYKHGTISAYNLGKCKCVHCRGAYADYRARRRAQGKDNPRSPRIIDTDPHISKNWFRKNVWLPAREAAGLDFKPRVHDLRHAHASWLLAGGADIQVVKERLGHLKLSTTEKYLHSLPTADETALAALDKIRTTHKDENAAELQAATDEIARLRAVIADQAIAQHTEQKRNLRPA